MNRNKQKNDPFYMSDRLMSIAEMVPQGAVVCDVGCDHAHVPIWLLKRGVIDHALGMDVIPGPLQKASANLKMYGESGRMELRQSDGLDAFIPGEADTLVISGMGGRLICEILLREEEKTKSFRWIITEPQSDPWLVRGALRKLGFGIDREKLIYDRGKYYPAMRAGFGLESEHPDWESIECTEKYAKEPGQNDKQNRWQEAEDRFGPLLLQSRNEVLYRFLTWRMHVMDQILLSLQKSGTGEDDPKIVQKKREVHADVATLTLALSLYMDGQTQGQAAAVKRNGCDPQ